MKLSNVWQVLPAFLMVFLFVLGPTGLVREALAGKGDRQIQLPRHAPLLKEKVLDLRFGPFAQGYWTRNGACSNEMPVDKSRPGDALVIFRGLLETPTELCLVYGAEQRPKGAQRAAMSCLLDNGTENLGLVTVAQRGPRGLQVRFSGKPPVTYRFCREIPKVTD